MNLSQFVKAVALIKQLAARKSHAEALASRSIWQTDQTEITVKKKNTA